jgi:phosphoribosyl-ATP pyrophosphohydrolase
MDWQSLLEGIKSRHQKLVAIQDEIGSSYADRASRNEALSKTVTEAIEGQVEQVKKDRDAVIQECCDFVTKTSSMRKAMGERLSPDSESPDPSRFPKVSRAALHFF